MPFFDTDRGRVYYRHWAAADPRAAIIFLHGFGGHTGVYHRYGFALNAAGIDLWAVDQFGHGLSPGKRGDFVSIEELKVGGHADRSRRTGPAGRAVDCPGAFVRFCGHAVSAARTARSLLCRGDLRRTAHPRT